MIQQGTDNLSRGIWCSPFHQHINQRALTASVFSPLQPDFQLISHITTQYHLRPYWQMCDWQHPWTSFNIFDKMTVWFPPPEIARSLLLYLLFAWSERPWTSEALIIVPRVLAGFWQGLSKHISELCVINPLSHALYRPPVLPIPIVVLHLAEHKRVLPTHNRLDRPPMPRWGHPHQQAAEAMRGMSGSHPEI